MDEHGQIGPEKGDYAPDCRAVAHSLREDGTVFVALAHEGSRLSLVLTHKSKLTCLGAKPPGIGRAGDDVSQWVNVAWEGHGSYWFDLAGFIAPGYLASKFHQASEVDAESLTEFLVRVGVECREAA